MTEQEWITNIIAALRLCADSEQRNCKQCEYSRMGKFCLVGIERAEKARDAAVVFIPRLCKNCSFLPRYKIDDEVTKICKDCIRKIDRPNFEWNGDGKETEVK